MLALAGGAIGAGAVNVGNYMLSLPLPHKIPPVRSAISYIRKKKPLNFLANRGVGMLSYKLGNYISETANAGIPSEWEEMYEENPNIDNEIEYKQALESEWASGPEAKMYKALSFNLTLKGLAYKLWRDERLAKRNGKKELPMDEGNQLDVFIKESKLEMEEIRRKANATANWPEVVDFQLQKKVRDEDILIQGIPKKYYDQAEILFNKLDAYNKANVDPERQKWYLEQHMANRVEEERRYNETLLYRHRDVLQNMGEGYYEDPTKIPEEKLMKAKIFTYFIGKKRQAERLKEADKFRKKIIGKVKRNNYLVYDAVYTMLDPLNYRKRLHKFFYRKGYQKLGKRIAKMPRNALEIVKGFGRWGLSYGESLASKFDYLPNIVTEGYKRRYRRLKKAYLGEKVEEDEEEYIRPNYMGMFRKGMYSDKDAYTKQIGPYRAYKKRYRDWWRSDAETRMPFQEATDWKIQWPRLSANYEPFRINRSNTWEKPKGYMEVLGEGIKGMVNNISNTKVNPALIDGKLYGETKGDIIKGALRAYRSIPTRITRMMDSLLSMNNYLRRKYGSEAVQNIRDKIVPVEDDVNQGVVFEVTRVLDNLVEAVIIGPAEVVATGVVVGGWATKQVGTYVAQTAVEVVKESFKLTRELVKSADYMFNILGRLAIRGAGNVLSAAGGKVRLAMEKVGVVSGQLKKNSTDMENGLNGTLWKPEEYYDMWGFERLPGPYTEDEIGWYTNPLEPDVKDVVDKDKLKHEDVKVKLVEVVELGNKSINESVNMTEMLIKKARAEVNYVIEMNEYLDAARKMEETILVIGRIQRRAYIILMDKDFVSYLKYLKIMETKAVKGKVNYIIGEDKYRLIFEEKRRREQLKKDEELRLEKLKRNKYE